MAHARLLAAIDEPSGLRYVGGVGAGFWAALARELKEGLDSIAGEQSPISGLKIASAVWARPILHVEIAYRGLTGEGLLRHASFKGLAEDP